MIRETLPVTHLVSESSEAPVAATSAYGYCTLQMYAMLHCMPLWQCLKSEPSAISAYSLCHVCVATVAIMQETETLGIRVFSFDAFAQLGSDNPSAPIPPKPEDLCTIMYTSGTTDKPKVSCLNPWCLFPTTCFLAVMPRISTTDKPKYRRLMNLKSVASCCIVDANGTTGDAPGATSKIACGRYAGASTNAYRFSCERVHADATFDVVTQPHYLPCLRLVWLHSASIWVPFLLAHTA